MKLKTVTVGDRTYAELDDKGMPVYVHDGENGGAPREIGFDAVATSTRIGALNREAQGHREAKEALEAKYRGFEGIDDPDAARQALATVKNLQSGDLKNAAQVAEIKEAAQRAAEQQVADATRGLQAQLRELTEGRDTLSRQLDDEILGGAFARSKFIEDKCAYPGSMLRDTFAPNFKREGGKLVPYGPDGQKIYSSSRPGEVADFDEGLNSLINAHPYRAQILKGTGHSGTGAQQGRAGAPVNGKPSILRTQFEALGAADKAATIKTHAVVDQL